MIASWAIKYLFSFDKAPRIEIGIDFYGVSLLGGFDFVNLYSRMENINRLINRSDSAVSLWNISNPIINIQVRTLSIYTTGFDELTETFDKFLQSVIISYMGG